MNLPSSKLTTIEKAKKKKKGFGFCKARSKHFESYFGIILIILIVDIVNSIVKIKIVKNHVDRAQLSIRSILFYNLIYY